MQLGWSTIAWKLSFAKNTMPWYSIEGLGTLYTNTLSLTRPFFSAKEHKELRIHKGVFESFSSLHTKRWKCINANNYGDKYISQMCVRYFRLLLQFYSRHYTVPDRVAMPSEVSNNFVYERQH